MRKNLEKERCLQSNSILGVEMLSFESGKVFNFVTLCLTHSEQIRLYRFVRRKNTCDIFSLNIALSVAVNVMVFDVGH